METAAEVFAKGPVPFPFRKWRIQAQNSMDLKRGNRVRIESCDTKPQLNLQQATSLWVPASGRSIEVGHELA